MDIPATIRKIKTELRLAMNGVASAYMRENGMNYKLNFGVELPRLRAIAAEFPADHDLAQALWKEDIRECKLLAAMLQPTDTFYPEIAAIWVESMPNAEIAQHTVQNLFCRLPYASQKAYEWIASEDEMFQQCGYLILARLFMQGLRPNERSRPSPHGPACFTPRAPRRRLGLTEIPDTGRSGTRGRGKDSPGNRNLNFPQK